MDEEKEIPTHKLRLKQSDEKLKKEAEAKRKQLAIDFNTTFSTPSGRRTLNSIMKICGFGRSSVGGNPALGMDIRDGTLYNAARQNIYLEIRNFLEPKLLQEVEFLTESNETN